MKLTALGLGLSILLAKSALAQTTPLPAAVPQSTTAPAEATPTDDLNFDEFGDADDKKVKLFATQKVLYISPTKLISVGYEQQGGLDLASTGMMFDPRSFGTLNRRVGNYGGIRLAFNAPVISRSNLILNLGLTYWNTRTQPTNPEASSFLYNWRDGIRTTGVNATAFKPLDDRHFLIIQANADLSGIYRGFDNLSSKALTYSGTAIYGWKRDDNLMWGIGATRTYRGGNLLYLPVLFYNCTFNPRWGIEATLPARANLRRNFGTNGLLMLGYELEGNVYYLDWADIGIGSVDAFLRRSEIKPRITFERKLAGFVWLSAQAGWAINWRYDVFATQNPRANEQALYSNTLGSAPYFNLSINLVSP